MQKFVQSNQASGTPGQPGLGLRLVTLIACSELTCRQLRAALDRMSRVELFAIVDELEGTAAGNRLSDLVLSDADLVNHVQSLIANVPIVEI